jgi:putative membrane protein
VEMPSVMTVLGYAGPPAPTLGIVAGAWRIDPVVLVVVVLAALAYLAGIRRVQRRGGRWPMPRTVAFVCLGLIGLVVTTMGWPGVYAPVLFSVYALQVVTLLMVVPMLLALGRPIGLAKAALGPVGAARLDAVLNSRAARLFTVPVASPLLLALIPFLIFFTPWYQATLQHPLLQPVTHVALLLVGLAVLLPLWEADTIAARIPYLVAMLFAFIELLADAVPGIIIRLDTHVIASGYFAALARPWGPTALDDQQLGGDFLWCIGEAVDVPFLALLVLQWSRADTRVAQHIDEVLDAARATLGPRSGDQASDTDNDQPWWETDASVFGDRAKDFQRRDAG